MTREQFMTLVEGTQREFRRFLVALCCGDSQLADDIAQESYIKAYLSADRLSAPDKFRSWIFRIGHNTFLNNRRSERPLTDVTHACHVMADEYSDSAFRYQELYAALDRIPHKERTSVLLYYMEGYSIKEIAEIEQTSQDAVKQHLSRGRNHLRNLLAK